MAFGTGCRSRVSDLDIQHALILNARLDENSALDDVKACAELLQLRGFSKNGVVGFCLGGRLAPLSLARGAGDVAVGFYAVDLEHRSDLLRMIKQPIQLHFGDKDTHVPEAAVTTIEEISAERQNIEVLRYPGGGHGFFGPI